MDNNEKMYEGILRPFPFPFFPLIDNGSTKPRPKPRKKGVAQGKGGVASPPEQLDETLCLLRATNGKKKISTIVRCRKWE